MCDSIKYFTKISMAAIVKIIIDIVQLDKTFY